jgi:hypothetical protein
MSLNDWISRRAAQFQYSLIGRPEHVIFFGYGLGDDLLCGTVARELQKRGARKIVMFSKHSSLFAHNPDVTAVYNFGYPAIGRLRRWGYSCLVPQYGKYEPLTDQDITPPGHFLEIMCRMIAMRGTIDLRTYLYLTPREKEKGRLYPAQAVIHSTGLATMANKRWPTERYQAVVDATRGSVQWIQLGLAEDPPIRGALDLRGRSTLRESAALIAGAKVFLGQAGFLMHLARAVDTRSVIVYGGREDPAVSGYRANENIVGRTVCSPCWQRTRCDYGHECMRIIEPDSVIAAVGRQLERAGTPLEIESVDLEAGLPAAKN